jgi:hypothetical protein
VMQSNSLGRGAKPTSTAVTACAAAGQWQHAVQLLQQFAEQQELAVTLSTSTADSSSSSSEQRQAALDLMQQLRAHGCYIGLDRLNYYTAVVAMRASGEVCKADAAYSRWLTAGFVQPWSTVKPSTLDVSTLYIQLWQKQLYEQCCMTCAAISQT